MPKLRSNSLVRKPLDSAGVPVREATDADRRRAALPAMIGTNRGSNGGGNDDSDGDDSGLPTPFRLEPQDQFVARFNASIRAYRQRADEAVRRSTVDALAMRLDGVIHSSLRRRQGRTLRLRPRVESDNPKDPAQAKSAARYGKLFDAIPNLLHLRRAMLECQFYGRAAAQVVWGPTMVDGSRGVTVTNHVPVNGDSVGYLWDGTPKIQIASMASLPPDAVTGHDDRGACLVLETQDWRDSFAIQKFEPTAPDWGAESDMALSLHGYGLRGRCYWDWWLRNEVKGWFLDALERIGANGMLVGFYEDGNASALKNMLAALKSLQLNSVAALPMPPGGKPLDSFDHIDPATVAYDVMQTFVDGQNRVLRQIICGQDTDATGPTADDAGMAEGDLDTMTFCDAIDHAEALTEGVLKPMIRKNDGTLPFGLKIRFQPSQREVGEKLAAIRVVVDLGMAVDQEDVYDLAGVSPPRDGANVVKLPMQGGPGAPGGPQGGPDGGGGPQGEGVADTGRSATKNLPPGLNANIPRALRAAGEGDEAATAGQQPAAGTERSPVHNARDGGPNCGDGSGGFAAGNACAAGGHPDDDTAAEHDDPSPESLKASLDSWRDTFNEGLSDYRSASTDDDKAAAASVLATNSLDYLDELTQGTVARHPKLEDFALSELDGFARSLPSDAPAYDVDEDGTWTADGEPVTDDDGEPIKAEWDDEEGDWDRSPAERWAADDLAEYDGDDDAETIENLESGGLHKEAAGLAVDILGREVADPGSTGDDADGAVEVLKRLMGGGSDGGDKSPVHNARGGADRSDDPGVMIALKIPSAVASALAIPGGEAADQMHITLGYLGRLSTLGPGAVERASAAVARAITKAKPGAIEGQVTGVGRFSASESSDGKDVIYAGADLPVLPGFRQAVVDELDAAGLPPKRNHGFTPHITLAYVDPGEPSPIGRLPGRDVVFDRVYVVAGDDWQPLPLVVHPSPAAALAVRLVTFRGRSAR